jgi:hypothetical protein
VPDDDTDEPKHVAYLSAVFDGLIFISIKSACNYKVTAPLHPTHIYSGDEI